MNVCLSHQNIVSRQNIVTCSVEGDMAVVKLRHCSEEVERPDVPHLGVADNLQTVGVEHAAQVLVEFVKFVDLSWHPHVPEHSVTQDQLV